MRGPQVKRPVEERFWKKVNKRSDVECWNWTGYCHVRYPHGQFNVGDGKREYAHRFMWKLINGDIPSTMNICHKCDNPKCVNPNHLFLGTQADNVRDMIQKGRQPQKGVFTSAKYGARTQRIRRERYRSENK